jgi:hypothetical protein
MAARTARRIRMMTRRLGRSKSPTRTLAAAAVALGAIVAVSTGAPSPAFAQFTNTNPSVMTVTDLGLTNVEMFFVSDFDPSDIGLHPLLFRIEVTNPDASNPTSFRLQFTVTGEAELIDGETDPIDFAPSERKFATNRDFTNEGSEFDLDRLSISTEAKDLEDVILETGFLPEGVYAFELILTENGTEVARSTGEVNVTNPRNIELIAPGDTFGGRLPRVTNPFPQFQWVSLASQFRFVLCPVLPGDTSGEEVMENQPVFHTITGLNNLAYPASAEQLANNHRYCWQVTSIIDASGGPFEVPSDIFCFRMSTGIPVQAFNEIMRTITANMPGEVMDAIMTQLREYSPTGVVTVGGRQVSVSDLTTLLEQLRAQGWRVGDVEVQ